MCEFTELKFFKGVSVRCTRIASPPCPLEHLGSGCKVWPEEAHIETKLRLSVCQWHGSNHFPIGTILGRMTVHFSFLLLKLTPWFSAHPHSWTDIFDHTSCSNDVPQRHRSKHQPYQFFTFLYHLKGWNRQFRQSTVKADAEIPRDLELFSPLHLFQFYCSIIDIHKICFDRCCHLIICDIITTIKAAPSVLLGSLCHSSLSPLRCIPQPHPKLRDLASVEEARWFVLWDCFDCFLLLGVI